MNNQKLQVTDLIKNNVDKPLITVRAEELVSHAINLFKQHKISKIPVIDASFFIGSIDEVDVFDASLKICNIAEMPIKEIMRKPYPIVKPETSIEEVLKLIDKENQAVLVDLGENKFHIITKHDIINSI